MTVTQTSILRQIVAGPRLSHPGTGLDFCYVTDNIIATSGPSSIFPKRVYRNPLEALVSYLDENHGSLWFIWEFRAEGVGYSDSQVYNRICHFPWPDHHPPPFALILEIIASMRGWLKGKDTETETENVAVVHCKAGKGRSGTVACSYLIGVEGWAAKDALARFTSRRMRAGFGEGVSIPSQQRWVRYVEWWTMHSKLYVERPVEILEVHVWGLRDGVEVAVKSFIDNGRTIKTFHTFSDEERTLNEDSSISGLDASISSDHISGENRYPRNGSLTHQFASGSQKKLGVRMQAISVAIFRPSKPVILPIPDINIDFERRSRVLYGFAVVTSVAHVWFNTFFESQISVNGPDLHNLNQISANRDRLPDTGVFTIPWESMDGVRGLTIKGACALDRLAVFWRSVPQPSP